MVRVCKKSNAKGSKGEPKFKTKVLNLVNSSNEIVLEIIYSKFPKPFLPEKPTFGNH